MKLTFRARHKGAIGIDQWFNEEVDAETFEEARLKLYEKYDHIFFQPVYTTKSNKENFEQ